MRSFWTAPKLEDEYQTFGYRVLHYSLLLFIGIAVVSLIFSESSVQRIFTPTVILLFGASYLLLHTNRYKWASRLFLGGFWSIITLAAFSLNGIRNSGLNAYVVVIIFASILFEARIVILFTVLSLLSGLVLMIGETQGWLPLRTTPFYITDRLFMQTAIFTATGLLLTLASRPLQSGITRLRANEQILTDRNQALEKEVQERKRIETTLRESERNYRLLFENTSLSCALYDDHERVILLNDVAAEDLGGKPADFIGKSLHDFFPPNEAESASRLHKQIMQTGEGILLEIVVMLPRGKTYVLLNMQPIHDANGVAVGIQSIGTDITERKRAEQQRFELNVAKERADFLKEFLNTVSHDIKTPLSTINTSIYLLERSADPNYRQQKLEQLKEQTKLLDKYIQDILTISRLDHLPQINRQEVDVNALLQEITQQLHSGAEKKQLNLVTELTDSLPVIMADNDQFKRALVNLVENAVNYTPAGGKVSIRSTFETETIVIEVRDTGIGIDKDELPRIFEQFYRTEKGRSFSQSGTGLGLAIVKKIIDIHGFTIDVESSLGEGTRFTIRMPTKA